MTLAEQAAARVEQARRLNREPAGWVASEAIAAEVSDTSGHLFGLPVEIGRLRSEWGLDLVVRG